MNRFKTASSVSSSRFLALVLWACGTFALGTYEVYNPNNLPSGPNPPADTPYTAWNNTAEHWDLSLYSGTHNKWGPKSMMFVYVRPTDGNMPNMKTHAQLQAELDNTSQFYFDESFRRTWFGTKVINPGQSSQHIVPRLEVVFVNLPKTVSEYSGNHNFSILTSDTFFAVRALGGEYAAGQRLDPANFDRIQIYGDPKLITSTGLAHVHGRYSWSGNTLSGWVVRHELGHNWGVYHANRWVGANGIPRNVNGTHHEYGAGADIMSNGFGSFNTMFKTSLSFLHRNSGDVADASSSGTYRIFSHTNQESNRPETRVRGLIVPVEGFQTTSHKLLFLGFRHTGAPGGIMTRDSWDSHAVTVHANRTSPSLGQNNGSHLIDTSPNSWVPDDRVNASIKVGRTYSEGPNVNGTHIYDGMHITPLGRGSLQIDGVSHYYMDVQINYGMSPGNQPPSASFSQVMFYGAEPGEPFTFSVNASDPDGDELAFDWDFGDDTYNVLNSDTQTKTWNQAGIYLVTATVSDMKGGVTPAQVWVNVGGVPLQSPDQPQATLPGLQYRYHQGPFARLPAFPRLFPVKEGVVETFTLNPRMRDREYAFVFEGYLEVPSDDIYTFHVRARDGHRLYISGQLMTERDTVLSSPSEDAANIGLKAGRHAIRVEMFNFNGGGTLSVDWSTLAMERTPIPSSQLHHRDWSASGPMTVSMLNPAPETVLESGDDLPIQAGVSASSDIERVVFFVGSDYLGEDTAPPYEATWARVPPGTWMLYAMAIDTEGRQVLSEPVSLHVTPPPRRPSIGINFLGPGGNRGRLESTDEAGAWHVQPHWNNAPTGTYASDATHWDHTMNTLVDDTGTTVTGAWTRYRSRHHTFQGSQTTLADTDTPDGRLFYSGLISRHDQRNPEVEVHGIPYETYDVYVYFDLLETNNGDTYATEFVLTHLSGTLGGSARPSLFGQNSLVTGDGIGDYPQYDQWFRFQEATATSRTDPIGERLGNYVVFREVEGDSFQVLARKNPNTLRETGISAIQIVNVEIPVPPPVIHLERPLDGVAAIPSGVGLWIVAAVELDPAVSSVDLQWSQVSGQEGASFTRPQESTTGVFFPADGSYVLRLTANDGLNTSTRDITVEVGAQGGGNWTSQDIGGGISTAGTFSLENGVYAVGINSGDIWETADSFHFAHQPLTGDGEIIARVAFDTSPIPFDWAKIGLMIREDLTPGSKNVMTLRSHGNGNRFQYRDNTNGNSASEGNGTHPWLRLTREGNVFTGYISADGVTWTQLGSRNVAMSDPVFIGLAFSSHNSGGYASGSFSDVTGGGGAANLGPLVDAGNLAAAVVGESASLNGSASDDGAPAVPGVLTTEWGLESGPGDAHVADAAALVTTVTFDTAGTHTLRLVADDGTVATVDLLSVEVEAGSSGPIAATVTLSDLDQSVDGSPKSPTVTTDPAELAVSLSFNGSSVVPSTSNVYAVIATVTEAGYEGSATATFRLRTAEGIVDSTGNGADDEWELATFGDLDDAPVVINGQAYTRRQIYVWGLSDPLTQVFAMDGMTFSTVPNRRYQLQFRASLTEGAWTDMGAEFPGNGNPHGIQDPVPGFYRVKVLLP